MTVHPNPRNLVRQMLPKRQPRTAKAKVPCSVEGCDGKVLARGWCSMHYARWRNTGSTDPYRTPAESCGADGCQAPPRSTYAEYCETHYYRLRRTGTTADPARASGECTVEDCTRDATTRAGYCEMHYLRLKKRGDVHYEHRGANVPGWTGDDATNGAVHQRLKRDRGKASEHPCADCSGKAAHWSYDHTDPNEKSEEGVGPYSTDISRYQPRCVPCHKKFDMAFVMAKPDRPMSQPKVRKITRARARDLCERCGRRRAHSLHHLKNRSQGGEWSPQNCVWLCGDGVRGCHGWVTEHPDAAAEEGFHLRSWEIPGERPIYSGVHGVVLLCADGSVLPVEGGAK